jgi:hypothetical protein
MAVGSHQQWVDLETCVTAYLNESEQGIHKYYKLWNIACRAMDELGLDFFYTVKSVKLPINGNLTVTLPADYINYTKIGVFNDQSEVIPLKYNNKLTFFNDLQSTRAQNTEDDTLWNFYCDNSPIFYNFWDGSNFYPLYGLPSGQPFVGEFKIDNGNGIILLNEGFSYPYLVLEYIASPKEGQPYFVPIQFREAVIAYLRWKDIISLPTSRRGNLGDKRDRRHEFYNERRIAMARYNPINLEEAYETNLRNQRLTVKA